MTGYGAPHLRLERRDRGCRRPVALDALRLEHRSLWRRGRRRGRRRFHLGRGRRRRRLLGDLQRVESLDPGWRRGDRNFLRWRRDLGRLFLRRRRIGWRNRRGWRHIRRRDRSWRRRRRRFGGDLGLDLGGLFALGCADAHFDGIDRRFHDRRGDQGRHRKGPNMQANDQHKQHRPQPGDAFAEHVIIRRDCCGGHRLFATVGSAAVWLVWLAGLAFAPKDAAAPRALGSDTSATWTSPLVASSSSTPMIAP